jgi:hypothetical protein
MTVTKQTLPKGVQGLLHALSTSDYRFGQNSTQITKQRRSAIASFAELHVEKATTTHKAVNFYTCQHFQHF